MSTSKSLRRLAVFGGHPAFETALHVGRPNLGDLERFRQRVDQALERNWLTNDGPLLAEFEERVADLLGVEHCIATCNGTMALAIAGRAAGVEGEVIVPAFTFVATAHAFDWQGIKPVFCDVSLDSHHIDPQSADRAITENTTAIVGVHTWGRAAPVEALSALAQRRGLTLLFDAAPAFSCTHGGTMIGGFGRAEALSFHATKVVNTIEGGAVVTNDGEVAERARRMRSYGFVATDTVVSTGTNAKMSEISAAMGLTSLESLEEWRAHNRENHEHYQRGLLGLPGLRLLGYPEGERSVFHNVVVEVDGAEAGLTRDVLHDVLVAENVLVRRYFFPGCHRMEPYRSRAASANAPALSLANTERLSHTVLSLPTGTQLGGPEIDRICGIVRSALAEPGEVTRRVGQVKRG